MRIATKEQAAALARLSRSEDGKVLLDMLRSALAVQLNNLIFVKPDMVQRAQGHAESLRDMIEVVSSAPDTLDKMEKGRG